MERIISLALFVILLGTVVNAWVLPDLSFVHNVAQKFERNSFIFHFPDLSKGNMPGYSQKASLEISRPLIFKSQVQKNDTNYLLNSDQDLHIFIIDDANTEGSIKRLKELMKSRVRSNLEYWLIDISSLNGTQNVQNVFNHVTFDIDDDVLLFDSMYNSQNEVKLWDVYKISPERNAIITEIGIWSKVEGLVMTQVHKWRRRSNLTGHRFLLSTMPGAPYVTDMILKEDGFWKIQGMIPDFLHNLQEIMNFTYDVMKPPDGKWGSKSSDGSWNGMVGQLQKREVDISPTEFTVTLARSDVISFLTPFTEYYHALFIKNPSGSYNYTAYTEPLHWLAWLVILAFVFFAPPFMWLTTRFPGKDESYSEFTCGKSYVFLLSAMTMRGWSHFPSTIGAQCAVFTLLLYGALAWWHWEAMLVSYLSTRKINLPFKNIEELVTKTQYKIELTPGTAFIDTFRYSEDPFWQKAYKDRMEPYLDGNVGLRRADFLEKVKNDPSSSHYNNYFSVITEPLYKACEVVKIPTNYDYKPLAWGIQKDSPFIGIFNYYFKHMAEKGSMQQIFEKYEERPQVCPDLNGKPLGMESCFTAFGVLIFGAGISVLLFITEMIGDYFGFVEGSKILNAYGNVERPLTADEEIQLLKEEITFLRNKLHERAF